MHVLHNWKTNEYRLVSSIQINQNLKRERERVNTLENVVRKLLSSMVNLHVHRTFDDGAITMSRRHHSEAKMFN